MFVATIIMCSVLALDGCFVAISAKPTSSVESVAQNKLDEIEKDLGKLRRDFNANIADVFLKPQSLGDEMISNSDEQTKTAGYVLKAVSLTIGQIEMARYAIAKATLESLSNTVRNVFVEKRTSPFKVLKFDFNEKLADLLEKRANEHVASDAFKQTVNEWKRLQKYMEAYAPIMRTNPDLKTLVSHSANTLHSIAGAMRETRDETSDSVEAYGNGLALLKHLSRDMRTDTILNGIDTMLAIRTSKSAQGVADLMGSQVDPSLLKKVEQVDEQIEGHVVEFGGDDLDQVDLHEFDRRMGEIRGQQ